MTELLPKGTYAARAVEAQLGRTSKGGEQVAVLFELVDGDHQGRRITWYGYFTDKTVDRTLESLSYCGWSGDSIQDLSGIGAHEVAIVVDHEDDQEGRTRARVRWVNSQGGLVLKEKLDLGGMKALDSRLKGKMIALKQSQRSREAEDDIPF